MQTHNITGGISAASIVLGLMMLGVSTYHATSFLWAMTEDPFQKAAMLATVVSLLASSHVLARLLGISWKQGRGLLMLICGVSIIFVELFSIGTSASSMSSKAIQGVRNENLASPEYKMAMQNVRNYQSQILSLQSNANKLPDNYVTKRNQIQDRISRLQTKMEAAQNTANNVNVSTTGKALDGMEARWHITHEDVSLTASLMLSIVPLVMGIAIGVLNGEKSVKTVKKPQRPNLKVVA